MERHELIKKYEKRLQECNPVEKYQIYQIYREFTRDLTELEQTKVEVPEFVAEWIETAKNIYSLSGGMTYGGPVVNKWLDSEDNQRTFALAWFDGYTIKKEMRYQVKMKAIKSNSQYLVFGELSETWWFGSAEQIGNVKSKHTRKEIEDAGFGEVFNSPLFEIVEFLE